MGKLDKMTIIGLVAILLTILYVLAAGNILHMLFNPLALIIVYGGTFSATLIAYPWPVIKEIVPSLRILFFPSKHSDKDMEEMIDYLSSLAEKARRDGIETLQAEIPNIKDKFLVHGVQMLIDGLEHDVIKDNLAREIFYTRHNQQKVSGAFRTMATVAPIFGLLGTLMGIVDMLRKLSDPANMGAAMSNAVTATFYGIFSANVFIPIATKLTDHSERDIINKEMIAEGIMAIQQGDVPLIVRKKLTAFIMAHMRQK
ncbi:MAG: MotA/TolQ/ExbB proton channel family protein [Nitrospiraceae bacterium]|nr:MotA/TolQ/ExbB proton channel family protein [Nitrospiraceae bacterium]